MSEAAAYVNHGRWVVECPSPDCRAALRFVGAVPVVCDCRDESVCDHGPLCGVRFTLQIPDHMPEIDRLLALRPDRATRNWSPGESVSDLKRENVLHGVSI